MTAPTRVLVHRKILLLLKNQDDRLSAAERIEIEQIETELRHRKHTAMRDLRRVTEEITKLTEGELSRDSIPRRSLR